MHVFKHQSSDSYVCIMNCMSYIKHLLEKCGYKVFTAWFFTDRPFNSQKFSDLKEYAVKKRLNFHKIKSKRSMEKKNR